MAGNSKTEKVELYVPTLEELRGGKYPSLELRARTINGNVLKKTVT